MQAHEKVARLRAVKDGLDVFFAVTPPENDDLRLMLEDWIGNIAAVIDSYTA